ncbi:hypothetical protein OsI_39219 [Oryza sativa Indica Group]|uniref:Uncharacterized protein n=1 Tax=Oryza sativa subsp. indica TaxID=39946 RepID=B8BN52_ORYSI|nr:hypothetical protein OsI_39219 [Oryza sativa Indica Group]
MAAARCLPLRASPPEVAKAFSSSSSSIHTSSTTTTEDASLPLRADDTPELRPPYPPLGAPPPRKAPRRRISPCSSKWKGERLRDPPGFSFLIGWPTSLPTNEKESFMKSVLREKLKALEVFSASDSLPLRPGVEQFIDDVLNEGVPVAILTTYGRNGEKTSRSIIEKLGQERTSKIHIVGKEEVERSLYGQLVLGEGVASSLDEQLVKEAQKAALLAENTAEGLARQQPNRQS